LQHEESAVTGEFTRNTFRPDRHFTVVRMQQGRVLLDADWNEQADIARWHMRQADADIIGLSGFPEEAAGFALTPIPGDLLIGPGRGYVAGRLLVNPEAAGVALEQISGNGAGTLYRIATGARLRDGQVMRIPAAGQYVTVAELTEDAQNRQQAKFSAALPAGTTELHALASIRVQPHLAPMPLPGTAGSYLAFLEVWERPIGALEDPTIREEALGGADTSAREQMVWQVKLRATASIQGSAGPLPAQPACSDIPADWVPDAPPPRLAAIAEAGPDQDGPCALPAAGGYRSLENHLYRVEVHNGGLIGTDKPSWKWSRDNASHRALLLAVENGALVVDSAGRDAATAFRTEEWLEVLDEARVLAGQPGFFVQLAEVNGNRLAVSRILDPDTLAPLTDNGKPDLDVLPRRGALQRWEGGPPIAAAAEVALKLENGVAVRFSAGLFRTGDFWTIPARSITADIVWPKDPASGAALAVPPEGIVRHWCKLAVLAHDGTGNWQMLDDCRAIFPPLTALQALFYLGGDAQEAMPDPAAPAARLPLAHPLSVGVARGSKPIEGEAVRFRILSGNGRFDDGSTDRIVRTGAEGRAETGWSLDSATLHQQVEARLLEGGDPDHLAITFSARLSRAAEIAFDPANCPPLAGDRTVQKAIERLCQQQSAGCATYVLSPDSDWRAVLARLGEREDAHVCFRRGTYKLDEALELKGLGHVVLSGAGEGSAIIAGGECALHFVDCASLHVSALGFAAPNPGGAEAPQPDLNGVLTTTRVARVEVVDCHFLTAPSPRRDRACLRIRQTARGQAEGQTQRVLVRDNRFLVGNGQIGVLVDDAAIVIVEDNEIASLGAIGDADGALRPEVVKALAARIARAPVIGLPDPEDPAERHVSAGRFTARLTSLVSQEDWARALRDRPPAEADLADQAAFGRYVRHLGAALAEEAAGDARAVPSLGRPLATIRLANAGEATREAVTRMVIADGAVAVKPVTVAETGRSVNMAVGPHRIAFDSVFTEAEWRRILRTVGTAGVESDAALRDLVLNTAEKLVVDRALRQRLAFARDFLGAAERDTGAAVGQGIVCAGSRLGTVRVRGNSLENVLEGIRVAVSHAGPDGAGPDIISSVDVGGNRIALRVPLDRSEGDQAIQIGNARRAAISRNEVIHAREGRAPPYNAGIALIGIYGPFVLIAENLVETWPGLMHIAIRMRHVAGSPGQAEVLWRAVGNLARGFRENAFEFPEAMLSTENLTPTS
jgi:hypothetical protein